MNFDVTSKIKDEFSYLPSICIYDKQKFVLLQLEETKLEMLQKVNY